MEKLRPNEQRGKIAVILIWAVVGLNLAGLTFSIFTGLSMMQSDNIGGFGGPNYYPAIVSFIMIFNYSYLIVLIISAITFIRWFRRAYYNLNMLTNDCVYDDSWAAKSWFIPFLNLYRPYEVMKDMFEKTDKLLFEQQLLSGNNALDIERLNIGRLKWWWYIIIILLAIYVLQFIITYFYPNSSMGAIVISNGIFGVIKIGLLVLSGVLIISIIKEYQKAEKSLISFTKNTEN